jgi:hypothetical protein
MFSASTEPVFAERVVGAFLRARDFDAELDLHFLFVRIGFALVVDVPAQRLEHRRDEVIARVGFLVVGPQILAFRNLPRIALSVREGAGVRFALSSFRCRQLAAGFAGFHSASGLFLRYQLSEFV